MSPSSPSPRDGSLTHTEESLCRGCKWIGAGGAVCVNAHPRHAPEAADVPQRNRLQAVEGEVLEVDVLRGLRLSGEVDAAYLLALRALNAAAGPEQGDTAKLQGRASGLGWRGQEEGG